MHRVGKTARALLPSRCGGRGSWRSNVVRSFATPAASEQHPPKSLQAVLELHDLSADVVPSTADPALVDRKLRFLKLLGLPQGEKMSRAFRRHPSLIDVDITAVAAPRVEYLLGLGVHQIGSLVSVAPQYLDCDLNQLHHKLHLLHALGLKQTARWLTRNPLLLHYDIETQIKPAVLYLREIKNLNLSKLISSVPMEVAFAPPEKTAAKLAWIREELGVEDVGTFLNREPRMLTYSVETNLRPKASHAVDGRMGIPARADVDLF